MMSNPKSSAIAYVASGFMRPACAAVVALCAASLGMASPASAAQIECPSIGTPYSIDLPLFDILAKPEAVAIVNKDAPGMLAKVPPQWKSTKLPSLATTITLRHAAKLTNTPEDTLRIFDRDLASVDIKDATARRAARATTSISRRLPCAGQAPHSRL